MEFQLFVIVKCHKSRYMALDLTRLYSGATVKHLLRQRGREQKKKKYGNWNQYINQILPHEAIQHSYCQKHEHHMATWKRVYTWIILLWFDTWMHVCLVLFLALCQPIFLVYTKCTEYGKLYFVLTSIINLPHETMIWCKNYIVWFGYKRLDKLQMLLGVYPPSNCMVCIICGVGSIRHYVAIYTAQLHIYICIQQLQRYIV